MVFRVIAGYTFLETGILIFYREYSQYILSLADRLVVFKA